MFSFPLRFPVGLLVLTGRDPSAPDFRFLDDIEERCEKYSPPYMPFNAVMELKNSQTPPLLEARLPRTTNHQQPYVPAVPPALTNQNPPQLPAIPIPHASQSRDSTDQMRRETQQTKCVKHIIKT